MSGEGRQRRMREGSVIDRNPTSRRLRRHAVALVSVLVVAACSRQTPSRALADTWRGIRWEPVASPSLDADAVVAGGPGFVAVGHDGPRHEWDAVVWVSTDGVSWERVSQDALAVPGHSEAMHQVVVGEAGFLAVGSTRQRESIGDEWEYSPAVWRSSDGYEWERVDSSGFGPGQIELTDAASWGSGFVVVGNEVTEMLASGVIGSRTAAVWVSPDSRVWTRVPHEDELFGVDDGFAQTISVFETDLVIFGRYEGQAAVWHSTDGYNWERGSMEDPSLGPTTNRGVRGTAHAPAGFVAYGAVSASPCPGDLRASVPLTAVVWASSDGVIWDRSRFGGEADFYQIDTMVSTDLGIVAFGAESRCTETGFDYASEPATWVSVDGLNWYRVDVGAPELLGLAIGETTLVGISGEGVWVGTWARP